MTRGTPATSPGAASFLFVFYKSKPTRLNTDGAAATCVPCASPVFASFPILTVATCLSVDRNEPGPPQLRAISTELSKNGDRMWKRATWSCGLTLGDITQKKSSGVPWRSKEVSALADRKLCRNRHVHRTWPSQWINCRDSAFSQPSHTHYDPSTKIKIPWYLLKKTFCSPSSRRICLSIRKFGSIRSDPAIEVSYHRTPRIS